VSCGDFSGCERTKVHSRHDERSLSCRCGSNAATFASSPNPPGTIADGPWRRRTVRGPPLSLPGGQETGPRKWNGLPAAQVESQGALSKRMSTAAPSLVVSRVGLSDTLGRGGVISRKEGARAWRRAAPVLLT
jgi:hypothetical protein